MPLILANFYVTSKEDSFDLGVNMSALIISRRVLLFAEELVEIYESHLQDGLTSGQIACIASHHHIRITTGMLQNRGFVSLKRPHIFHPKRVSKRGINIREDKGDLPLSFPEELIEQLIANPRSVRKQFAGGPLNPPLIVHVNGMTEAEYEKQYTKRQNVKSPTPLIRDQKTDTTPWPLGEPNEAQLYLMTMALQDSSATPEDREAWSKVKDIVLRAFWLACGLAGRRIFNVVEKGAIVTFCGKLGREGFTNLVKLGYIKPLPTAEFLVTHRRPPRKYLLRRELGGSTYVTAQQIKQALKL